MSIKKHVSYNKDSDSYCGLVDLGSEFSATERNEAKESLNFMTSSLDFKWKILSSYFLIDKIGAETQKNLVITKIAITL